MSEKILSPDDLIAITGYKVPSKQIEVLRKYGIEPIRKPDNTLTVLWKWLENMSESKTDASKPKLRAIK